MAPPPAAIPPPLPPSVEEAYRRKCIQLRQRMNEVEEANDASRLRIQRITNSVEKLRLERAFLLEQLAKRTSTNVEDSEGSPSPPPTPKEKPLRTKRGHRKPSFLANLGDGLAGSAFIHQGPTTLSPSSDAFSHTHHDSNVLPNGPQTLPGKRQLPSNGNPNYPIHNASTPPPKKVKSGFDLWCSEEAPVITRNNRQAIAEGQIDVDRELALKWQHLDDRKKEEYQQRFEVMKRDGGGGSRQSVPLGYREGSRNRDADEDIEMGEDSPLGGEGGFTAVNRG